MDISVFTGTSKASQDIALLAKSLETQLGEQCILLIHSEAEPDAAKSLERECLSIIKQSLLDTEGDPPVRLDSTLKELNGLLKGLTLSKTLIDVHAIIAIVDGEGLLHVSHAGRAEAYVVRHSTASQITEYTRGKSLPAFVHIASGQLEPGDTIVLSTQRLLRAVTPAQLAQLANDHEDPLKQILSALEVESEEAAIAVLDLAGEPTRSAPITTKPAAPVRRRRASASIVERVLDVSKSIIPTIGSVSKNSSTIKNSLLSLIKALSIKEKDPRRNNKMHLFLLAGVIAVFLVVWAGVNVSSLTQKSQVKSDLMAILDTVEEDISSAETRRLRGDMESANTILNRAEERTKQVMNNESGLFRTEALDVLDRIRVKREEISNIIRLTPSIVASLADKNPDIQSIGFIGLNEEAFIVYDKQDTYSVNYNRVEDPKRLSEEELIVDGVDFPRYQTQIYLTTGNGVIEMINGSPVSMKTDDPGGWISGKDMKPYLRFLYVLVPNAGERGEIYKYERLSNRYGVPAQYNINGDLSKGLDMAIDGNIYILKEGGTVVKLLRGEAQPFTIRNAPESVLENATKIYKVFDGKFYFLDPKGSRVIVVTDGGASGESAYLKQYVFEGDQIGTLQDLYVDPDESRLYVLDEKRVYKLDLGPK